MDELVPIRYTLPLLIIGLIVSLYVMHHYYCRYFTQPGREIHAEICRRRLASYRMQIWEITLSDTTAAVACNDIPYLARRREKTLNYLYRLQCITRIALFLIRHRP